MKYNNSESISVIPTQYVVFWAFQFKNCIFNFSIESIQIKSKQIAKINKKKVFFWYSYYWQVINLPQSSCSQRSFDILHWVQQRCITQFEIPNDIGLHVHVYRLNHSLLLHFFHLSMICSSSPHTTHLLHRFISNYSII